MKIYTRGGDKGLTSLYGGKRVAKDDIRIEAYGTVDELNCLVGLLGTRNWHSKIQNILLRTQNELFNIGSHLATEDGSSFKLPTLSDSIVKDLEKLMDDLYEPLPALKTFILPGGTEDNALAHLARTVCRRAERRVVALSEEAKISDEIVIFLNRLSDFFFVLARHASYRDGKEETKWSKD